MSTTLKVHPITDALLIALGPRSRPTFSCITRIEVASPARSCSSNCWQTKGLSCRMSCPSNVWGQRGNGKLLLLLPKTIRTGRTTYCI